jgi:hypothetical protein
MEDMYNLKPQNKIKMKNLINFLFIIIILAGLFSCAAGVPITKQAPANNKTYEVEYLFEHDGCKVYRFTDYGNFIYFTNCNGEVSKAKDDSTGSRVINIVRTTPVK